MTIDEALRLGKDALLPTSDAPDIDAYWLLMKALTVDQASYLITHGAEEVSSEGLSIFNTLVEERKTGKPLAYILGWAEFYGRRFIVNPSVLIPRPATETLIEQALPILEQLSKKLGRPLTIADIGTGTGCIAVTLALESPHVQKIFATDVSEKALEVARENTLIFNLQDIITFLQENMLEPLQGKPIDFIVSNPPYVPSQELQNPETKETRGLTFEPQEALDGGSNGLIYVNQIVASGIPALVETVGGDIASFNL